MISNNLIIIDDDQPFREALSRSLERLGFITFHFDQPSKALERIAATVKPTILLDLKLESDSGLRWIKKIRKQNAKGKIVLLTGYASISTAVEAIKLGADDYLTKPTTAREIILHLEQKNEPVTINLPNKPMSVERLEWEHIQKILNDNQGNVSATARALGMHRRTLQRKLAKKPVRR
ncbi:MAG: two-component system response regulator [Gammaproteobacteria bacterium]|nr:MAG: two-component system response regulator [Gammaproteobacteria bacterium]